MSERLEYRCHNCNRLLYKASGSIDTEVICPGCRRINYPHRSDDPAFGLRGKDFQMKAMDLTCPVTHKLLLRVIGDGVLEVESRYCAKTWIFDTVSVRMGRKPESLQPLTQTEKDLAIKNRQNLAT